MDRGWRKSQCGTEAQCVEVAWDTAGVRIRDSKDPDGPVLRFDWDEWDAFVAGIKDGEFDRPAVARR